LNVDDDNDDDVQIILMQDKRESGLNKTFYNLQDTHLIIYNVDNVSMRFSALFLRENKISQEICGKKNII
jgi:hypothetical protein